MGFGSSVASLAAFAAPSLVPVLSLAAALSLVAALSRALLSFVALSPVASAFAAATEFGSTGSPGSARSVFASTLTSVDDEAAFVVSLFAASETEDADDGALGGGSAPDERGAAWASVSERFVSGDGSFALLLATPLDGGGGARSFFDEGTGGFGIDGFGGFARAGVAGVEGTFGATFCGVGAAGAAGLRGVDGG